MKKYVVYSLTRGYSIRYYLNYRYLVVRNLSIKFHLRKYSYDHIIFHEGNINGFTQKLIQFLSLQKLNFINVFRDFKPHKSNIWTGFSDFPISYSLMCQFNYYHCWKYLEDYEYAIRIDEDCRIKSFPNEINIQLMQVGAIVDETHSRTLETLPIFLKKLKLSNYLDGKYPYTNFFITKVEFWRKNEVEDFLFQVYSNENSLEYRWGDLVILGVALKRFGHWESNKDLNREIKYKHGSHGAIVENGKIKEKN